MSSKNVERVPLPVRRRGSIAARLAWLYLGVTGATLSVAAGFLHWGVGQSLRAQDQRLLESKTRVLRTLLRDPAKAEALASEIEHEAGEDQELKYYMRIMAMDGRVMLETPEMGGVLPPACFPKLTHAARRHPLTEQHRDVSGREFLLLTANAVVGPKGAESCVLQLAIDTAHNGAILADCRRRMLIVVGVGIAFAAAAGVLVARTGLKPLEEITRTTRRITATKLDERLTPANWPLELRDLARAFDAMLDRRVREHHRAMGWLVRHALFGRSTIRPLVRRLLAGDALRMTALVAVEVTRPRR